MDFILCDDLAYILEEEKRILEKVMFQTNYKYQIHLFQKYDQKFMEMTNKKNCLKIYILDIEVNGISGIDIARQIRQKDNTAIIIFLSQYERKYKDIIFQATIRYYQFINKRNMASLGPCIEQLIKEIKTTNILAFDQKGEVYTIRESSILFITTNKHLRKTIIATDYDDFYVTKTLNELQELLTNDFIRTHNSYIVNRKRVIHYSFKKKTITLDNHVVLKNAISRRISKEDIYHFIDEDAINISID